MTSHRPWQRNDDGFTLVELLVVLAIIGLIAAIAAPQVLRYLGTARVDSSKIQMRNIGSALELLYIDIGRYPSAEEGLNLLVERPTDASGWNGPYLKQKSALVDPWGSPYEYTKAESDDMPKIFSLGKDRKVGGEGDDADIYP